MLLSIGMMVKNESKYLRRCLESLQPIRDVIDSELIIVDTGSIDNTVQIAKEFTDKVYFHEWKNNFSEMRNTTISYCNGDWFMCIDGDEVINNPYRIIQFFKTNEYKNYNTACVKIRNFSTIENEDDFSEFAVPRLFKKDKDFYYEGAIHEQPKFKQSVLMLNSEWLHYGYITNDKELMERKFRRTATILENELKNNPENVYYLFQLSVSYAMHGDYEESLEHINNAYNIIKIKENNTKDYLYIYGHLAKIYLLKCKYKEAEDICLEAVKEENNYIDLYFYLAKAQFIMNKNEQAIENFNIYLEKVENYNSSQMVRNITIINDTLGKYETAYLDLSILYMRIGEFETALKFAEKILSNNILVDTFDLVILSHINLNKYDELRNYYEGKILTKHIELRDRFLSSLEQYLLKNNSKTRNKVNQAFSEGNSEYSWLNRLRIMSENACEDEELIKKIEEVDFNKVPNYYGDFIYYLICKKRPLENILGKISEFKIKSYFDFLLNKYEDLGIKIYEYLRAFKNSRMVFNIIRINKILAIYVFKSDSIDDEQYQEIFDDYLENGYYYLQYVYNKNIIENELVYSMKDEEDSFLMYMHLAKKYKEDKAQYLRNLAMATNSCKYMRKGIEMLSEEVGQHIIENSYEMDIYKKNVKESIIEIINNNNLIDAKKVIAEYEKIIKDDPEINSMKAVIAIMENRLDDAEIILNNGLKIDENNFDLLFNLGYVYECTNRYIEAIRLYSMAKENCTEVNSIKEIEDIISKINEKFNI